LRRWRQSFPSAVLRSETSMKAGPSTVTAGFGKSSLTSAPMYSRSQGWWLRKKMLPSGPGARDRHVLPDAVDVDRPGRRGEIRPDRPRPALERHPDFLIVPGMDIDVGEIPADPAEDQKIVLMRPLPGPAAVVRAEHTRAGHREIARLFQVDAGPEPDRLRPRRRQGNVADSESRSPSTRPEALTVFRPPFFSRRE